MISTANLLRIALFCVAVIAFGCISVHFGSSDSPQVVQATALATQGVAVTAKVIPCGEPPADSKSTASLAYNFVVNNKTYRGLTHWMGRTEYLDTLMRGRISVKYLPSDPSVSSDDPQGTIANHDFGRRIGAGFIAIGVIGLCGVGAVAWVSSRNASGSDTD